MIMNHLRFFSGIAGAIALTVFAVSTLDAQTVTTTIVDDSFSDDSRAVTGASGSDIEIPLFGTSGTNAIQDGTGTNTIGLVTGTSGRQIHGIFPTQTLALAGDTITSYFTFTTPETVMNLGSDDIRIGLFSDGGNTTGLSNDLSASTGTPEPLLNGLSGFAIELDVDPATTTDQDVNIRRSDPSTSGRLLGTNTGISNFSSSADNGFVFAPSTTYELHTTIERTAAGALDITAEFFQGGTLIDSDNAVDTSPLGFDFGLIAAGASTNAFGSTNSFDTPGDNGIEIDNITIEFTTTEVVPEPGSAMLLLSGLGVLGLVRRRK